MHQFFQHRVDRLLADLAHPLAANRAFVIDNEHGRRGGAVPLTVDVAFVVERSPSDVLLRHYLFEFTGIMLPGVDADEGEWLVLEFCYERPLVRPGGPSDQSGFKPEVQQHHLAAIVTQFELRALLVFAFDVGRNLANA